MSNFCCSCKNSEGNKCTKTGNNIELFIILELEPDFCPKLSKRIRKAASLYSFDDKVFRDYSEKESLSEKEISYCKKVSALKKINKWFICIFAGFSILFLQLISSSTNTKARIEQKVSSRAKHCDMIRSLRRPKRRFESEYKRNEI